MSTTAKYVETNLGFPNLIDSPVKQYFLKLLTKLNWLLLLTVKSQKSWRRTRSSLEDSLLTKEYLFVAGEILMHENKN
jgi:hypothetical protein